MIKKIKSKKSIFLILYFLFIVIVLFIQSIFPVLNIWNENNKISQFYSDQTIIKEKTTQVENDKSIYNQINNDYIAILEIPAIKLKKGLVSKDSKFNVVDKNIQILKESDMPDVTNGTFILASHSGNSSIAYFKNLHKLIKDDEIFVFYNHKKYQYKITNIYLEVKNGKITIHRNKNNNSIVLTTCSKIEKGKQLIIIGDLVNYQLF